MRFLQSSLQLQARALCCWAKTIHPTKRTQWRKIIQKVSLYDIAIFKIFVLLKLTCLVTLDCKHQVFKTRQTVFGTVHSKCKRSSLRSQCRMRLFLWLSNTVCCLHIRVMKTYFPCCPTWIYSIWFPLRHVQLLWLWIPFWLQNSFFLW